MKRGIFLIITVLIISLLIYSIGFFSTKDITGRQVSQVESPGIRGISCSIPQEENCRKLFEEAISVDPINSPAMSIAAFANIFYLCSDNIYGAKALLQRASLEFQFGDKTRSDNTFLRVFTTYRETFPEISMKGLHIYIANRFNSGDCDNVIQYIPIYFRDFQGRDPNIDAALNNMQTECRKVSELSPKCEKLYYNGAPFKKFDIVFIADEYTDIENFLEHARQSIDQGIFYTSFLRKYRDKFNFYWVNQKNFNLCKNNFPLGPCDEGKIKEVASVCPYDRIIVLSKKSFRSRAPGIFAMVSIQNWGDVLEGIELKEIELKILEHEIGHSFFRLADEYVEPSIGDYPRPPNCFNTYQEATRYWNDKLNLQYIKDYGFYNGCSYLNDNIRGTRCSVMGGGSDCGYGTIHMEFGPINEAYIEKFMESYDPVIDTESRSSIQRAYGLNLRYDNGEITSDSVSLKFAYLPDKINMPEESYSLELLNNNNEVIYEYNFLFPTDIFISRDLNCFNPDGTYDESKCPNDVTFIQLSQTSETIDIPYFQTGKEIRVYNPNNELVLTVDVTQFSDYCGDETCSITESDLTCPLDCGPNV